MIPITKRELKAISREKSFILLIVIELLLLLSSNLFSVGYLLISSPEEKTVDFSSLVSVAVVSRTPFPFQKVMERTSLALIFYDDFARAHGDFLNGKIDAILFGDITLSNKTDTLTLYLPKNNPKINLIKMEIKDLLQNLEEIVRTDKKKALSPALTLVNIENSVPFNPASEVYFIFTLPLLLFLPSLISGSLIIDNITEEFEKKTIINLKKAPLTNMEIVLQKLLAVVIIALLQCIAWLIIIGATQVKVENVFWIVLLFSLYALFFSVLAASIALKLKSQKLSQTIFTVISLFALATFSPVISKIKLLVDLSPAHLMTALATGCNLNTVLPGFLLLFVLLFASSFALHYSVKELDRI